LVYNLTQEIAMQRVKQAGTAMLALLSVWAISVAAQTPEEAAALPAVERGDLARFRARAEAALTANGAEKAYWGALIVDAQTGETLYALNAGRYFRPASNIKLFTTTLALATLGADFRTRTTIETTSTLESNGLLRGDLVLVGRGDANLSNRVFPFTGPGQGERSGPTDKALAELADQVVAHGVKQIRGDIVADDSYFVLVRYPSGWTVDDTVWSYGTAVSAIAVNDNVLSLEVRSGARIGSMARVSWDPWPGPYSARVETRTVAKGTADAMLSLARDPESKVFVLGGTVEMGAPVRKLSVAVPEPAELAAAQLKRLLEVRGVRITGESRAHHASAAGESSRVEASQILAQRFSPTLLEDVRLTNKLSDNLHSELMLRVAGKEKAGAETMEDALKFAAQFYESIGLVPSEVAQADGSGLSRSNLVTPQSVVNILSFAATQTWGEAFAATLPVVGVDGTLEYRMRNTAAAGRVRAKTGTINGTAGFSGYATTRSGQRLIFSFFGNNNAGTSRDSSAVLDALAIAMVEEFGTEAVSSGTELVPELTREAVRSQP
jgi:D-alanyl-D-alanine carboxypeptidase/D-alanyl-D-alanine-endopeptidase (penicillin-binding protein 4)